MSMAKYEDRRENLWKEAYKNDPAFEHGDSPAAKVISFFCKRRANEPEVDITKQTIKSVDFSIVCDVEWVSFHLNRTLKYKRKWYGDVDIYKFVALQNYVDQCTDGNFSKCLLSKQEYMSIKPKKK